MTDALFDRPREFRPRRRRARPVPPGCELVIVQRSRTLALEGEWIPDLLAAAGVTRYQRALDGSDRWLTPRRELVRILRAADCQQRLVTVQEGGR